MSDVFISHSHQDKIIARRIARRLSAYGIDAWLDERELRIGAVLTPVLQQHIQDAKLVLVVASDAAARSDWVTKEIGFALSQDLPRPICPFFVEDTARLSK